MRGIELSPSCPVCLKEMITQEEEQESDFEKQNQIKKWQSMNIELRFYEASFDNFDAYNSELQKHLETCRNFAEKPNGKLILMGENGNGKTHLAISILKKVGGRIFTAYEIGLRLRQSFEGKINELAFLNELSTVPLLVVDEVEKVRDTEAKQNWFSHVIGKRYDRRLPTVFIANCHLKNDCKEVKKPCPRCLEFHLENNILSRINEKGTILKFNSGDYREKIRTMKLNY